MTFKPYLALGLAIVFISVFTLFFIFDSLNKLAEECKRERMPICSAMTSFTLPMLIILLIISGFIIIIYVVAYLLLTRARVESLT